MTIACPLQGCDVVGRAIARPSLVRLVSSGKMDLMADVESDLWGCPLRAGGNSLIN